MKYSSFSLPVFRICRTTFFRIGEETPPLQTFFYGLAKVCAAGDLRPETPNAVVREQLIVLLEDSLVKVADPLANHENTP